MKPIEPIIVRSMPEFCALISLAYAISFGPSLFISTYAYITLPKQAVQREQGMRSFRGRGPV